jgi:hypothetical protein
MIEVWFGAWSERERPVLSTRGTNGVGTVAAALWAEESQQRRGVFVRVMHLLWRGRQLRDLARRAEWAEQARRTPPLSVIDDEGDNDEGQ